MKRVSPGEAVSRRGFVFLAAVAIAFAVGLHIYRMAGMAFTNYDDMLMGLTVDRMRTQGWWSSYLDLARVYAVWQGRIYFYFSMFFFVAPFLIRSLLLRAAISALLQLGATCSMAAVVGMYAGFANALLVVALACLWLPYWPAVSPVNGFPFVYHLPVILFFTALAISIARSRGSIRWRGAAALSWIAFLVSLFFYEALIPPFGVLAVLIPAIESRRAQGGWNRAALVRAWAPWMAGFLLWAGVYLGYRHVNPGTYGGSALAGLGGDGLSRAAASLYYFESYSLPGANWVGNLHYTAERLSGSPGQLGYPAYFFRNLTADGVLMGVLLAALLIFRVRSLKREEASGLGRIAAVAVGCAVLCPLPLAFTAKYRSLKTILEVGPYLPGYYSFLAWSAAAALAVPLAWLALDRLPRLRRAAFAAMAAAGALVCAASAMTNDAIYAHYAEAGDKWGMVDRMARSRWFASLPAHSVFLAPGLWDNFPQTSWYHGDPYWTAYFSAWAGRPLEVIRIPRRVPELLARHTPVFYCEHQWLAGRLASVLLIEPVTAISSSGDAMSDAALLFARGDRGAPPTGMRLEYRTPASDAAGLGPLRAGIPGWQTEGGAYIARVPLPGLIAGTAQVVDAGDAAPPDPVVTFGRGISGLEHDADHYWRWSDGRDGEGELSIFNPLPHPVTVRFRAALTFAPDRADFDFHLAGGSETLSVARGETIERTWRLAPGDNRIVIRCHAGRMPTPGDSRYIVFGIRDWSVTPVD